MDEEHTVDLATATLVSGAASGGDDAGSGEAGSGTRVQVTLIDANHCPGAAMMLFRGYFGVILHTGDFRFVLWVVAACKAAGDVSRPPRRYSPTMASHPALAGVSIDHLYIDNTYCHPQYAFPQRLEAAQAVVELIRQHPAHRIVLGVDTLGKEELLHYVAAQLGMPVRTRRTRLLWAGVISVACAETHWRYAACRTPGASTAGEARDDRAAGLSRVPRARGVHVTTRRRGCRRHQTGHAAASCSFVGVRGPDQ